MKVTYIHHSGYMVELEKSILLFDWWKGDLPVIDPEKDLYVFVSHAHEDHYSENIWAFRETYPVQYIVFEEIAPEQGDGVKMRGMGAQTGNGSKAQGADRGDILRVVPHQEYELPGYGIGESVTQGTETSANEAADSTGASANPTHPSGLHIETLLSTDQGVAFLVQTEGKTIYHAGDLNIWYWDDEPEEDNRWQVETYKEEMKRLAGKHIDVAFVPMDPRLGDHAVRAAECFLERNDCDVMFPMHYWERMKKIQEYLKDPRIAPYADIICTESEEILL